MTDLTRDSDRLLDEARRLRDDNRDGGRHRRSGSIGQGSANLKSKHWRAKLVRIALAVFGIFVAAGAAGIILNGIGFAGVMMTVLALIVAVGVFSQFPKMKVPKRADINRGDVRTMVGRTELWLEAQRPHLPAAAAKILDTIGAQLDALGQQLEGLDPSSSEAVEVRKLVGEHLPEMVESYRRVPAHLRREQRAGGKSPDEQFTDSLANISREIDTMIRGLAEGTLDELAVRGRFLEYKYGEKDAMLDGALPDTGVPLPDLDLTKTKAPR